jgi:hypothetical protein
MLAVLTIVAPVFTLMGMGYLAARFRYLPDGAAATLAQFGFKVAMPAFLFRAMLGVGEMQASPLRLLAAYFLATATIWLLASLASRHLLRRPPGDDAALAMGACFGNTVMLGVPIAVTAFGPYAATPLALLIAVETPLLWIAATLHMEAAGRGRTMSLPALRGVLVDLALNPIVASLVLGLLARLAGLSLPTVPDRILAMLAQAAVPTALFAMGMTLAGFRLASEWRVIGLLSALKLIAYPAIAWLSVVHLFALPPLWSAIAVLLAAMPVGANAYLFAARYDRAAAPVSAAIAASTLLAVVTVSLLLLVLTPLARQ